MSTVWRIAIFLSIVLTVYGGLNFYFIWKSFRIMKPEPSVRIVLILLYSLLAMLPVLTELLRHNGMSRPSAVTGFIGYTWISILFMFLFIHGTAALLMTVSRFAGHKPGEIFQKKVFLSITAVILLSLVYGFFEARMLKIRKVSLETDKLPAGTESLSIAFFSDVHFSPLAGPGTAERIVKKINGLEPDLILCGGDLTDPGFNRRKEIASVLSKLNAPLGKYTVLGNHEFFAGLKESTTFIEKSGFTLLRNESVTVQNTLNISGIDDPASHNRDNSKPFEEEKIFESINDNLYTIFLKHQPTINLKHSHIYDLQLSGHTHGGQMFPFHIFVKLAYPFMQGYYKIDNNTDLFVSKGAGTWGPPYRILARPEIVHIELKNYQINGNKY